MLRFSYHLVQACWLSSATTTRGRKAARWSGMPSPTARPNLGEARRAHDVTVPNPI